MQTVLQGGAWAKPRACTVLLGSESAYKGVSRIVFQPRGLRLFLSNQSCMVIYPSTFSLMNQSSSILTNQKSAFWTTQTIRIGSPHLHEDGPIRGKGQDFSLFKSAALWLGECTFLSMKDWRLHFPVWGWNTKCVSPDQNEAEQTSAEQSCLAGEGPCPRAASRLGFISV